MSKDKHALIKANIALNKRVQELETTVDFYQSALRDADRRVQELESRIADDEHFVAEILEQNKRYREAIEVAIHNMPGDNLGDKYALGILEQTLEGEE